MASLPRFWRWRRKSGAINDPLALFKEIYGSAAVKSGVTVNWTTAIQVAAVFACMRVIAESVAALPFKLYRSDGVSRKEARDHSLFGLLHKRPNAWQSASEFLELVTAYAVLTGNGYALINRVGGNIAELLPLPPNWVNVKRLPDWSLRYTLRPTMDSGVATEIELPAASVLHLRGPSWDGARGLDAVKLAREAIGLSIGLEESHARLHGQGVLTPGTISVEGKLTDEQYKQLRAWIAQWSLDGRNAGTPLILDDGAKWSQMALSSVDAQHIETRRLQVEEVCRFFRVFPLLVMQSDKAATFASAEQFFNAHNIHTVGPWLRRWQGAVETQLLTPADLDAGMSAEFTVEALLHADIRAKADFLQRMALTGIMTRNETRGKLGLEPLDGLDEPMTPFNEAVGGSPAPPADKTETEDQA